MGRLDASLLAKNFLVVEMRAFPMLLLSYISTYIFVVSLFACLLGFKACDSVNVFKFCVLILFILGSNGQKERDRETAVEQVLQV